MKSTSHFDDVVIGAGVGGLLTAGLLSRLGHRVCVLERRARAGGYVTFCEDLHYLWNCGPNDEFGRLLQFLGLQSDIPLTPLSRDSFDRIRFPSFRYDYKNGIDRNIQALSTQFPEHESGIKQYFAVLSLINDELYELPPTCQLSDLIMHPLKLRHLAAYGDWTTEQMFDSLSFPQGLRSILAGQSGDIGLPPSKASLLIQAAVTCGYMAGAYVPEHGYRHLFETITNLLRSTDGCEVKFNCCVNSIDSRDGRVSHVRTTSGECFQAGKYVYNGDPKLLRKLLSCKLPESFSKQLDYTYSISSFLVRLHVDELCFADQGRGDWNYWHYEHDDINQCYQQQIDQRDLGDPMLFIAKRQRGRRRNIAQQLIVCTPCSYDHFAELIQKDRAEYQAQKRWVADRIIDLVQQHYVPGLREHLTGILIRTPINNERSMLAPRGNIYGPELSPDNIRFGKLNYTTPLENLVLVGAAAGTPSFAGGTHFANMLVHQLTGQKCIEVERAEIVDDTARPMSKATDSSADVIRAPVQRTV